MNRPTITAIIRHLLTFGGGFLVSAGYSTDGELAEAIGAVITLIGFAWSLWSKYQANRAGSAPVLLLCGAIALPALAGCATTETTAYRAVGSTTILVDTAMQAWGDYVRSGQASMQDIERGRALYGHYQDAMRVLHSAIIAWRGTGENRDELDAAMAVCESSASDLANFIHGFVPETVQPSKP